MEKNPIMTILMVEDDADDRMLMLKAFQNTCFLGKFCSVDNGAELINYLSRIGPYNSDTEFPYPRLIMLDLNMPKMDGKEVLLKLKSHEQWRKIPVIIFTTSKRQDDIEATYKIGSNSYITKPDSFDGLKAIAQQIEGYWCKTVELPA